MGKITKSASFKRKCAACGQREDPGHGLAMHYNCLTCVACKSFFYRSGKQLRVAGVGDDHLSSRKVYERVLDNHKRYAKCLAAGMDPVLVLDPSKRPGSAVIIPASMPRPQMCDSSTQTDRAIVLPSGFGPADIPRLLEALLPTNSAMALLGSISRLSHGQAPQLASVTRPNSGPSTPTISARFPNNAWLSAARGSYAYPTLGTSSTQSAPRQRRAAFEDCQPARPDTTSISSFEGMSSQSLVGSFGAPAVPDSTLTDPLFQEFLQSESLLNVGDCGLAGFFSA